MRGPFFHGVGGVLSADIAVPDHAREVAFYARVLTTGESPLWRDDLTNNRGDPVIGLGPRSPEYEALPLQWMPHIQVADVAASAARALELGGRELLHARDDDGRSQWAVLTDPAGAAFGVIPVVGDGPVAEARPGRVGRIAWLTLVVPDVPSACRFYERVVGWSAAPTEAAGGVEMRRPDGVAVADIRRPGPDEADVPTAWILGLPVDDLAESLRRVGEAGGTVLKGSADAGHAVIRDPVGACIALQAGG
ncbi:MAG: hypothetical protein D6738_02550 [Acidobacteria bacterium]|nr:MAG: hypothetical protein D6738_02550 [Acidobacteriota bacterium]